MAMKNFLLRLALLLSVSVWAQLDSLSYAAGYQLALACLSGSDASYNLDDADSQNFVGGFEEDIPLVVRPGHTYEVDWEFAVYVPAGSEQCDMRVLNEMKSILYHLMSLGVECAPCGSDAQLIYRCCNNSERVKAVLEQLIGKANSDRDLMTSGYKFVCWSDSENQVGFGVVGTSGAFQSKIKKASLNIINTSDADYMQIEFRFGDSLCSAEVKEWAEFTGRNIGNVVVCELNGQVVMAPRINAEITGGACAITGLSVGRINTLFADSVLPDRVGEQGELQSQ